MEVHEIAEKPAQVHGRNPPQSLMMLPARRAGKARAPSVRNDNAYGGASITKYERPITKNQPPNTKY